MGQQSTAATAHGESDTPGAGTVLRRATLAALVCLAASAVCGMMLGGESRYYDPGLVMLTRFGVRHQDLPVMVGMALLLAACGFLRRARPGSAMSLPALSPRGVLALLAGLVVAMWLIRTQVLFDHDFTRDEQMASFDAAIYGAGRLFWPFPAAMRPLYGALNDLFLLPVADHSAWVSNYLPVNALFRAGLAKVLSPSWASPLLTGLAGLLLWRIAVRLWPGERAVHTVVLLCFVGSSQVVLMGTANFAMSLHLALNLAWLALFLKDSRAGHAGALLTGLLATGIHQPVFHPLFVLPFLELLRRQGRWRTLAFYVAGYAAIGAVWLAWPHWVVSVIAAASDGAAALPAAQPGAGQVSFLSRLLGVLAPVNADEVWIMGGNLLRFATWQHVALLPLAFVGIGQVAGKDDLARALAQGALVLMVAMMILLAPQGHGWGYRYMHGVIGSLCLLTGYGWHWLATRGLAPARAMLATSAASLLVLLPLHAWMVRGFVAPFAQGVAALQRVKADFVIVESGEVPFGTNLVINRPDLANRPLLLLGDAMNPGLVAGLCPGHAIAFADAQAFNDVRRFYGMPPLAGPALWQENLRMAAQRGGCRIVPFALPDRRHVR